MAGLFGGSKPQPSAPATMPDDQSPAVLEARRREREKMMSRAGRSSTIMTTDETRGNGDSYAGKTLGSGAQ